MYKYVLFDFTSFWTCCKVSCMISKGVNRRVSTSSSCRVWFPLFIFALGMLSVAFYVLGTYTQISAAFANEIRCQLGQNYLNTERHCICSTISIKGSAQKNFSNWNQSHFSIRIELISTFLDVWYPKTARTSRSFLFRLTWKMWNALPPEIFPGVHMFLQKESWQGSQPE